jgi:hypothetical protein
MNMYYLSYYGAHRERKKRASSQLSLTRLLFRAIRRRSICIALTLFLPICAVAAPLMVTVNTEALSGMEGLLAFDLIDGGPSTSDVTISGFISNGNLGTTTASGAVTGQLPGIVKFSDTEFFNELTQQIAFGTSLSFIFDTATRAPATGSFPDSFALFILDPLTGRSLFPSSDPSGSDALLLWSSDLPNAMTLYDAAGVQISVAAVPEPGTISLLLMGGMLLVMRRIHWQRRAAASQITFGCAAAICRGSPRACLLYLAILGIANTPGAWAADVTATTDIKKGPLLLNRTTNTFDSTVTITNTGSSSYGAPLRLAVVVTPSTVSLANGTGVSADGKAFIEIPLPNGALNQGQSVRTTIKLHNLPKVAFSVAFTVDATPAGNNSLPPDPGPAGAIPLLGIDSDRDGVRDDIQRYIALTYPGSPDTVQALRILAVTYQDMLKIPAGSLSAAKTVNDKAWRNRSCLVYLYGASEGHRRAKQLFAEYFNTLPRYKAWAAQDDLLAGQSFESPRNRSTTCDFAVTTRR